MELFLPLLVVVLMLGGAGTFLVGLLVGIISKKRRQRAFTVGGLGFLAFVAGTVLGQFTA